MEDKQLNLNQPFLSVRRTLIPYYNSELKSGPVVKEGAVPFHWEQTPGKPREDMTVKNADHLSELPPFGHSNTTLQDFRRVSSINNEIKANFEPIDGSTEDEDGIDEEDDYVDALDTLSRTNSTFLNCSTSGVSILEDSNSKPCRDFTRDPNTLKLVMDRFLPAAKAMVSEKSDYAMSKKLTVIRGEEESKDLGKTTVAKKAEKDNDKPSLRYSPSYADQYCYDRACEERGKDEDSDDGSLMPSVCGLLPRFCSMGSSGILGPFPGVSVRTRIATSHGSKIRASNCPSPEIGDGPEDCDVIRADTIEADKARFKPPKKVSKTFAQLLKDEDGQEHGFNGAAEKVLTFNTIETAENRSLPNELGHQEEEEGVDSPWKDVKNSHLVDVSNSSTAADDVEGGSKISEVIEKKYSELIIAPPLPKSPSDSWLWRTLPSVSAKNIRQHSNLGQNRDNTRHLNPKVPIGGTMWEAIVKSSKQQHDDSRYPEEILTPLQKT